MAQSAVVTAWEATDDPRTPAEGFSAVQFSRVTKHYGSVQALAGVSFRLQPGETVALLGPNGAGKSTAIGIMLGLLPADGGGVSVLGRSPETAVREGRVGAMLQSGGLLSGVTVRELVGFIRGLYPHPLGLDEILERADLGDVAGRRVDRLSGGQTQRVRFALAIAGDPELVFLDEPTTGMDVETRRAFWETMRAFAASGRTVLFATHYLDEADAIADRIILLNRGTVAADGPATAIKASATTRLVRFTLPHADLPTLCTLPGVKDAVAHGDGVRLTTTDADATVRALYAAGVPLRDLEVAGGGLEEAFIQLTRAADDR